MSLFLRLVAKARQSKIMVIIETNKQNIKNHQYDGHILYGTLIVSKYVIEKVEEDIIAFPLCTWYNCFISAEKGTFNV